MTDENISVSQAKEEAIAGFVERGPGHLNCAQTVVYFAMRLLGRDPGMAFAARYMGGGMARMGHTCGALSGAVLALGLRDLTDTQEERRDAAEVTLRLQTFVRDFHQEFSAVGCLELTGHDLSTREGYRAFAKSDAQPRCAHYVAWAIDRLSDIL